MCLIIAKTKEITTAIPTAFIEAAAQRNPHGFGIVGKMPDGAIYTAKSLDMDEAVSTIRAFEKQQADLVAHFRYATHGEINETNCHPFKLGSTENYLVHNGIVGIEISDKTKSDTWHFAAALNRRLKSKGYTKRQLKRFMYANLGLIKTSKFVTLGEDIPLTITNAELGSFIDGVWYSNEYSLQPRVQYLSEIEYDLELESCEICGQEITDDDDTELDVSICAECVGDRELPVDLDDQWLF